MAREIDLFGIVGEEIRSAWLKNELREAAGGDVTISVFSPGGDYFEGSALYALLSQHQGRVEVKVLGLAASAAAYFIMGADEILIDKGAQMMVHNSRAFMSGDKNDMRKKADQIEKIQSGMIQAFVSKTGKEKDEIESLLDEETWMSAEEAVAGGFADRVIEAEAGELAAMSYSAVKAMSLKNKGFSTNKDAQYTGQTLLFESKTKTDEDMNEEIRKILALGEGDSVAEAIKGLKAQADRVEGLEAKIEELKPKAEQADTLQARVDDLEGKVVASAKEAEADRVVREVLDETGRVMSEAHITELKSRAKLMASLEDEEMKKRVRADMVSYAEKFGAEQGSAFAATQERRSGEEPKDYQAAVLARSEKIRKDDPSISFEASVAQARQEVDRTEYNQTIEV